MFYYKISTLVYNRNHSKYIDKANISNRISLNIRYMFLVWDKIIFMINDVTIYAQTYVMAVFLCSVNPSTLHKLYNLFLHRKMKIVSYCVNNWFIEKDHFKPYSIQETQNVSNPRLVSCTKYIIGTTLSNAAYNDALYIILMFLNQDTTS